MGKLPEDLVSCPVSFQLDPKAGLILVKAKLYGPRGDTVVNLALDTGEDE